MKRTEIILGAIFLLVIIISIFACSKHVVSDPVEECQAITLKFKDTNEIIIHWCSVCDTEDHKDLTRFRSYPKESPIAWCDSRIQVIVFDKVCTPGYCKYSNYLKN